jgi:hypothetical protein
LSKLQWKVACPAASGSNGFAICLLSGVGNSRRSDLIRNSFAARIQYPNYGSAIPVILSYIAPDFALKTSRRERNFGTQRQCVQIAPETPVRPQRQNLRYLVAGNPRRNALFGVAPENCGLLGLGGGAASPAKPVSNAEFPGNRAIAGNFSEFGLQRHSWDAEIRSQQRSSRSFLLNN